MKPIHLTLPATISAILLSISSVFAQDRIPLNQQSYDSWKNIERPLISNNGRYISFEINPQTGDGVLLLTQPDSYNMDTIHRAYDAVLSPGSSFIVYKVKPLFKDIRKAKLDGKKKDELPNDSLGITDFRNKKYRFPGVKSFSVPASSGNCIAGLLDTPKPAAVKDSALTDTTHAIQNTKSEAQKSKKNNKSPKKDKTETFTLKLIFPADSLIYSWDSVTSYVLSDNGKSMVWASYRNDSIPCSYISMFETAGKTRKEIFNSSGFIRGLALDTTGTRLAFLQSTDTSEVKRFRINYFCENKLITIADTSSAMLTTGFSAGENGKVYFSQDGTKLYFGISPTPRREPKDTLTDDEKARVDVWHWQDPLLQPQQLKQLDSDKKRTYLTVYHIQTGKIIPLADEKVKSVNTGFKGNGRYALGFAEEPYLLETSWKDASYRDVYLIDNETGIREQLLTRHNGPVSLSTTQKYLAWYNQNDSLWYTMDLKHRRIQRHFAGKSIVFYDEEHDVPSIPGPAGYAGWTENDRQFVVYDLFDLWGLDLSGKDAPLCLTGGDGRKNNTRYRNLPVNPEVPYIGNAEGLFLSVFDETNKEGGFCQLETGKVNRLKIIEKGPYKYSNPARAKNAGTILWTKGNFRLFPDLWISNSDFSNQKRISDANPQQKNYLWGNVELVSWTLANGKTAGGLLYKPEGFDTTKRYPMLVYFYEKYTDQLHQHYVPKPSRSIVSPTYCSSNGYLVFIPDISYRDGYPGQSAYEYVISGTEAMIARGYADKDHIGIQGQSWGGYQTAWLVTRTNLFKAAMAGAPVSNMTSAYGGIRWESGVVRQFQYEEGQSRIGATLWERPDLYIENSPLFQADKIKTPLLIMSNDGDGAVPWYQGIELFTALRRLEKPVWMLNYNGDEHNLARRANMKDLDRRMMQFFDHYLKDAPAPEWMIKGVPAIDKGKKTGFEIQK